MLGDPQSVSDTTVTTPTQKVRAYHNVSLSAYEDDVTSGERGLPDNDNHQCSRGIAAAGTWSDANDVTIGAFYCYFTNENVKSPALAWTTKANRDSIHIYNRPGSSTAGLISLYKYWVALKDIGTT